jgi:hypothetical protein
MQLFFLKLVYGFRFGGFWVLFTVDKFPRNLRYQSTALIAIEKL